jgi:hypothetical protein
LISIVEHEPLSADRWISIAKELGTDRSAYLCAKRYMQVKRQIVHPSFSRVRVHTEHIFSHRSNTHQKLK